MVRVKMVVMERNSRGGDDDGVVCSGGDDVVEDGEVIVRIVTGMVTRDINGIEGASLELEVVVGLGEDGVEVVWWKDLLVMVVQEKVKEMVKSWWSFGVCSGINGDGGGRR